MRFARTAGMAMLSLIAFVSGGLGLQAISANGNWLVVSGMEGGQELAALSFNYWKLCQIENGTVGCGPCTCVTGWVGAGRERRWSGSCVLLFSIHSWRPLPPSSPAPCMRALSCNLSM